MSLPEIWALGWFLLAGLGVFMAIRTGGSDGWFLLVPFGFVWLPVLMVVAAMSPFIALAVALNLWDARRSPTPPTASTKP